MKPLDRLEEDVKALRDRVRGNRYPEAWADRVEFFRVVTGLEPDPWQADVLGSDAQRIIELACRQAGKSLVSAVLALHTALYTPRALVLLLSPSLRQSQELFRKVLDAYRVIESRVPVEAESALRIEFPNRSRIVALPGTERTTRGHSAVTLLIVDEAARVEDELFFALLPVLAVSNGRLMLLSTPFGSEGYFHDVWTNGGEEWARFKITAHDCPRISDAFLEEQRRIMPVWFFNSEFGCAFEDNLSLRVFSPSDIAKAFQEPVESWDDILASDRDTGYRTDEQGVESWNL